MPSEPVWEGVVIYADTPDRRGDVFRVDTLRALADGVQYFWDETHRALLYRGPPPPRLPPGVPP